MRILLVEPDKVQARLAKAALARHDHNVAVVSSGQRAVDALDAQDYEAVILEPQLGLHNGIELLYELRSYAEWRTLPVLIWTLNSQLTQHVFAKPLRQLGIDHVLYKPTTSLASLAEQVNSVALA